MATSLAAQLAGIQANNNATILDKNKRKKIHSVSLVYDSAEASSQDFETIYRTAAACFAEMVQVEPRLAQFQKSLFSETSVRFDRSRQAVDQVDALNQTIERFLRLISRYFNLEPALGTLEWLIRRFHVHLLNAEQLLLVSLPWYRYSVFVRILEVIPREGFPPIFEFLKPAKQNLKSPSWSTIVRMMSSDVTFYNIVGSFLINSIENNYEYETLLTFWSSVNIRVCMACKEKNQVEFLDTLLPWLSRVICLKNKPDSVIAGYMVMMVVFDQFPIETEIVNAAISTILASVDSRTLQPGLACISQIVRSLGLPYDQPLTRYQWEHLEKLPKVTSSLISIANSHNIDRFLAIWAASICSYCPSLTLDLLSVLKVRSISDDGIVGGIITSVLKLVKEKRSPELTPDYLSLVEFLLNKYQSSFEVQLQKCNLTVDKLEFVLESSIVRPAPVEEMDNLVIDHDEVATNLDEQTSREDIMKQSAALDQDLPPSHLQYSAPNKRAVSKLWTKLAACSEIHEDDRLALLHILPESEVSFLISQAIGPYPLICKQAALSTLQYRLGSVSALNYQLVLPCLLYLLSDPSRDLRFRAAQCIKAFQLSPGPSSSHNWGVSTIYGSHDKLETLSQADLNSLLKKITSKLEECILDPSQVVKLVFKCGKSSWAQVLISHAKTIKYPQVLCFILDSLAGHKGVALSLQPLYSEVFTNLEAWKTRCAEQRVELDSLITATVGTLYSNDEEILRLLLSCFKSSDAPVAKAAATHLQSIWPKDINEDSRYFLFFNLLDIAIDDTCMFSPQTVLETLKIDTQLFERILDRIKLQRNSFMEQNPTGKRRRRSSSLQLKASSDEVLTFASNHLRTLTLVLELLEPRLSELVSPHELIPGLFGILDELVALSTDSNLPVWYTEELLSNCLIYLTERLKSEPNPPKHAVNSFRVDIIVSCIRTTSSPQVQNRLLLLVASLATLCPDLVFHSVMPIFTFMGATTVRMDNDYSAHVIQQTISQVIPALVARGDKNEEIEIVIRIFVAAFPHIPRHRRNKLYSALVQTLGPLESLHKLLLVLAQKYAETRFSSKSIDAKSLVHFATTFSRSFSPEVQLSAMSSYLEYLNKLIDAEANADMIGSNNLIRLQDWPSGLQEFREHMIKFLALTCGNDTIISGTRPLYQQISHFTSNQLSLCTGMVNNLLLSSSGQDISPYILELFLKILNILPLDKFVEVISPIISEGDEKIKLSSLQLVEQKFESTSRDLDVKAEASLKIIEVLKPLIAVSSPGVRTSIIDAIDTIVAGQGQHIPVDTQLELLDVITGPSCLLDSCTQLFVSSVCCVNSLCQNLGARTIGFFPRILPVVFSRCEQVAQEDGDDRQRDALELATIGLISGLIRRIPSFMNSSTKRVLQLVLKARCDVELRMDLIHLLCEKAETATVLSAYVVNWDTAVNNGTDCITMFLESLNAVIERASKKDIFSRVSQLFGLILRCFSIRGDSSLSSTAVNQIEAQVISTTIALILKLDDKSFQPQFLRITRWAFEGEDTIVPMPLRHVVFLKFFQRLQSHLKSLVTGYFGYILDSLCEIIETPRAGDTYGVDSLVLKLIYEAFLASFRHDQEDFWRSPSRFEKVLSVLLAQLDRAPVVHGALLVKTLTALSETCSSLEQRKTINDGLAQRIRSDVNSTTKFWAIRTLRSLYKRLGEDWVTVLPQLVPLIAELLEDEDESVELEVRKRLVPVIEELLGESLDRYLS